MLQKIVPRGFADTVTRPVFLCLQMKQHDLDTSTQEKTVKQEHVYIIILFICSGLNSCRKVTFIVSVISSETS